MAEALVLTADAAFPFPYANLPKGVSVVLGYVGQRGCTPHVWTASEVSSVHAHGYKWAPIWVPPMGKFTHELAEQAANGMTDALRGYAYPADGPVFLDIERHVWELAPAETVESCRTWEAVMTDRGHSVAVSYLPSAAGHGWAANWTGSRPASLPADLQGQQYAGNVHGGQYDLSVFRPAVFAALTGKAGADMAGLDKADQTWIVAQLKTMQDNLNGHISALHTGTGSGYTYTANLITITQRLEAIQAATKAGVPITIDAATLAADLVKVLGPELGASVAAELAKRLAS